MIIDLARAVANSDLGGETATRLAGSPRLWRPSNSWEAGSRQRHLRAGVITYEMTKAPAVRVRFVGRIIPETERGAGEKAAGTTP